MDSNNIFEKNHCTIIHGDSNDVLKSLKSKSVNLIITSPPYFGCRVYGDEKLGREEHPIDYVKNLLKTISFAKRILSDEGSLYLNVGDVYFGTKGFSRNKDKWSRKTDHHYKSHKITSEDGKYLQHKQLLLLPSRIAIGMQNSGWVLRNDIIWEKPNPIPSHSNDRRLPVYEHIFHFVKSKKYYFDYPLAKEKNHHRDVIRRGIEPYKNHQATFPESLIEPLVLTSSREGDVVLDFFSGSGTTGAVACKNNRKYIGIELNKEFCEESLERISNVLSKNELFEIMCQDRENKKIAELISSSSLKRRGRPQKR